MHQEIKLSKNEVKLWHGQSDRIEILTPTILNVEITIDNEQIADARINKNNIIINTKDIGNTNIYIKGTPNYSAKIKVYSCAFNGTWIENEIPNKNFIYEAQVISDDNESSKKIEQELLQFAQNKYHSMYAFDFGEAPLVAKIRNNNDLSTTTYKGTYIYDKINKTLILEYDKYNERYDVKPYSYNIVQLTQNLTKEYQKKYPDIGIKDVVLTKYLTKSSSIQE